MRQIVPPQMWREGHSVQAACSICQQVLALQMKVMNAYIWFYRDSPVYIVRYVFPFHSLEQMHCEGSGQTFTLQEDGKHIYEFLKLNGVTIPIVEQLPLKSIGAIQEMIAVRCNCLPSEVSGRLIEIPSLKA